MSILAIPAIPAIPGQMCLSFAMINQSWQNPPSCVLFDFDGTMYSFSDVYPHVWLRFYNEQLPAFRGLEFQAVYDRIGDIFASFPRELDVEQEHEFLFDEIKRIWPGVSETNERLISDYQSRSLEFMTPRPGLDELLGRLDAQKIPWGIVSNHDGRNRHKLAAMELRSQPATFMLSVEVGVWKPDSRIFEMAFEEIGPVDRAAAVMIGDTPWADIAGGRAAGMRTVLMSDEPHAVTDNGGADLTIGGFEELQAHWFG